MSDAAPAAIEPVSARRASSGRRLLRWLQRGWGRTFHELPEKEADQNRTGVAFVAVLFSIAVGEIAKDIVQPVKDLTQRHTDMFSPPWAAVSHYAVALVLTVTSFVGYFASKNGPQLRVKFFNLPFVQIVLDSTMVVLYFFMAVYAENVGPNGSPLTDPASRPNPRPEAFIVLLALTLYCLWDFVSYRIQCDPYSQLAIGRRPDTRYGARRFVTIGFLGVAAVAYAVSFVHGNRWQVSDVVWFDVVLIILLLLYRVAKSWWDRQIRYRDETTNRAAPAPSKRPSSFVPYDDWVRLAPAAVRDDGAVLALIADRSKGDRAPLPANARVRAAAERLRAAGALEITCDVSNDGYDESVHITDAGYAYLQQDRPPPPNASEAGRA